MKLRMTNCPYAHVQAKIKTILNDGLPDVYDKRIFDDKRSSLYDYVFETM